MTNSTTTKSKLKSLIVCSVIIFVIEYISSFFLSVNPITELGPASALPPIFGLMFGPWGAGGAALGYLVSDISSGTPPELYILSFFVQFLYGYLPYKLWYTLDIGEMSSPRLNNVKNLIKFVTIMFINAVVMAGLLGFLIDGLGLYDLVSLTTLIFALNNFDFSIMLGTIIIIGANIYGISMYKPRIIKNPRVSPNVFNILAFTAIIIAISNSFYSAIGDIGIFGLVAGTVTYSLFLVYVLKPVTKDINEKTSEIKISITEKLIVVFIVVGAIVAIVTGIRSLFTVEGNTEIHFWELVYLNVTIVLSIFYISSIGFLWYIEKNITTPIESISNIARNYVKNSNKKENNDDIIAKCAQYTNNNDEIGILALSFQKMISDLKIYIKNLEQVTAEKERINAELNVAKKIQADMLPNKFPAFPERNEFDVYATNIPAKEVGGDFYDFFLIDETHLAIVIADVSGKGVPAALFMVIAKTLIKNHAQLGKSPSEVFKTVNNQLYEGNDENMFVTAWMGILEIETGIFTYVNAGHNPPLLKHADKDYNWLKSKPGFVLAGLENIKYHQNVIILKPGDRVYLYTDGVTEAINSNDELFGESNLIQIMNNKKDISPKELLSYVKEKIDNFVGNKEQFDDITMLIMEYKG